jgi:hypothetical protein
MPSKMQRPSSAVAMRKPDASPSSSEPSNALNALFRLPNFAKLYRQDQLNLLRRLLEERKQRLPGEVNPKGELRPALSPLRPSDRKPLEAVQSVAKKGLL